MKKFFAKLAAWRIDFFLFIAALLFLSFVGGAASYHYQWRAGRWLQNAFEAGHAWRKREKDVAQALKEGIRPMAIQRAARSPLPEKIQPGYTLLSNSLYTRAYLMDARGKIVHVWALPFSKAWSSPSHVKRPVPDSSVYWFRVRLVPHSNGDLLALYQTQIDTPYGYGLVKLDKDSKVIWRYAGNVHHDFSLDAQGNIYGITQAILKQDSPHYPFLKPPMLMDYVVKLDPGGNELTRVEIAEAFGNSPFRDMLRANNFGKGDYFHTNTAEVLAEGADYRLPGVKAGQVLISIRNQNLLAVVDLEARAVVWAARGPWRGQHQPQFLANGNILLFDNLGAVAQAKPPLRKRRSRVMEYDPAEKKIVWSYEGDDRLVLFTPDRGMVSPLPNGNILIAEGRRGRVLEVTRNKELAWVYREMPGNRRLRGNYLINTALRYGKEELPFLQQEQK